MIEFVTQTFKNPMILMRLFYPMTLTTCVCFIRETLHIRNIQQYNRKIRKPFSHTSIDTAKNKINNGMNSGAKHTISCSVETHACMSSPRYVCCTTSRRVLLMLVELNRECVEYTPVVYCSVATSARFVSMKWNEQMLCVHDHAQCYGRLLHGLVENSSLLNTTGKLR